MWHIIRAGSAAGLAVPAAVRARAPPPLQPLHWIAFNGKWRSRSSLLPARERHTLLHNSSKAPAWSALINTRKRCLVWEEKAGARLLSCICFGCSVCLFLRHPEMPSAAAPPHSPSSTAQAWRICYREYLRYLNMQYWLVCFCFYAFLQ